MQRLALAPRARGYLFNDPLEDTEICLLSCVKTMSESYLFNDPLEDTEIIRASSARQRR